MEQYIREEDLVGDINPVDVFNVFKSVFRDDVRYKILDSLSTSYAANLRELSRQVGISHKNISKYLNELIDKGILRVYRVGTRRKIYMLSNDYSFLKDFFLSAQLGR